MARPKSYEREEILDRAMQAFWRKGYEATSTSDLEAQMGVNRYSLYAEFQSKHGLYHAALERYLAVVVPGFIGELHQPGAGLPAIDAVLERFAAAAGAPGTERGCMICNAATETSVDDPSTRDVVQRYVTFLEEGFRRALDQAVLQGELAPDLDTTGWSRKLATTLLGMFVLIRARVDGTLAREAGHMAIRELHAHRPVPA